MDAIMPIANKHGLKVVEDACQSPYVEYDGRKLGLIGDCGAISFNVWKTLGCGEGGAIVTTKDDVARECDAFRNNGRTSGSGAYMGMNYRPTEFQAALLITQTVRYREQAPLRRKNVAYLEKGLKDIPGIRPLKVYRKTTHHNHYNYHMHYDADAMGGLPIDKFTRAMRAEGIPFGSHPDTDIMSQDKIMDRLLEGRHYKSIYTREQLRRCQESRECPKALHFTRNIVNFSQAMLLGTKSDMDDILEAIQKIRRNAGALAKA
jgi:dTDP-4-amino-4,6-dideoxygalactose transaminase